MTELESFEQKLAQLVALHTQARDENRELRNRALLLEGENKKLLEKVAAARAKIEAMIERLPADEEA
jgi:cell division protein ZapB